MTTRGSYYAEVLFFLLNLAMSWHMLHEPIKNAWRLTILAQHTVTVSSTILVIGALVGIDPFLHLTRFYAHLSYLMVKIAILFTGLFLAFMLSRKKTKNPVTKRPITVMRVARNLYCHYGTTVILWWLGPDTTNVNPFLHNIVIMVWFFLISSQFNYIYDIEGISTKKIALPLAVVSLFADGLIWWLLRIKKIDE